jgi:hypothetical protein
MSSHLDGPGISRSTCNTAVRLFARAESTVSANLPIPKAPGCFAAALRVTLVSSDRRHRRRMCSEVEGREHTMYTMYTSLHEFCLETKLYFRVPA